MCAELLQVMGRTRKYAAPPLICSLMVYYTV